MLGIANADGLTGTIHSGRPDLRNTAVGASVDYTLTTSPYPSGTVTTSNDKFTFAGHEKVTTPAGTFDTCKVRYALGSGAGETYWLAPNKGWVRFESISATGVRASREALSH